MMAEKQKPKDVYNNENLVNVIKMCQQNKKTGAKHEYWARSSTRCSETAGRAWFSRTQAMVKCRDKSSADLITKLKNSKPRAPKRKLNEHLVLTEIFFTVLSKSFDIETSYAMQKI